MPKKNSRGIPLTKKNKTIFGVRARPRRATFFYSASRVCVCVCVRACARARARLRARARVHVRARARVRVRARVRAHARGVSFNQQMAM